MLPAKADMVAYFLIFAITALCWLGLNYLTAPPKSRPKPPAPPPSDPEPLRNFTKTQLRAFDGAPPPAPAKGYPNPDYVPPPTPVYTSLLGTVFDVSSKRHLYGPGGSYNLFAGKECGQALAKMSFEESLMEEDYEVAVLKLSAGERASLQDWYDKFKNDYPIVGRLVSASYLASLSPDSELPFDSSGTNYTLPPTSYSPPVFPSPLQPPPPLVTPLLVGVGRHVYDASFGGAAFYRRDLNGAYALLAGGDASVSLAKMKLQADLVGRGEGRERAVKDKLTEAEDKVLKDWVNTFKNKKGYVVVGRTGNDFDI